MAIMRDEDITPRVLLDHIQGLRGALTMRMDKFEHRLDKMESHLSTIGNRFDRLENKVDRGFALINTKLSNMDKRLDEIEIEELPKRVSKLESAVFI